MTSTTSKALPYVSLGITFAMLVLNGFGFVNVDVLIAALPVLTGTAVGGLYNAKVQAQVEQYKILRESPEVQKLIEEIEKRSRDPERPEAGVQDDKARVRGWRAEVDKINQRLAVEGY